jgi:hypothetical protein
MQDIKIKMINNLFSISYIKIVLFYYAKKEKNNEK